MGSSHLICSFIGVLILWKSPGCSAASSFDVPLRGTAVQSSTYLGWSAGQAIDGSCDFGEMRSCAHSDLEDNPWWRLKLDGVFRVSVIEITNRKPYGERLEGVEIRIGNSLVNNGNDNPSCAIINNDSDNLTQTVHCFGMEGMYVNFYKPVESTNLTLCEVKVYGELVPPPASVTIEGMRRNVILVTKQLGWSDALLYCRDFHKDLMSIRSPEEQRIVNELVANQLFPVTSQLWVGLHRSSQGNWVWMSGDEMSSFDNWDPPTLHSSACGGVSSMAPFTWRQRSCDENLNFICFTGQAEGVPEDFEDPTRVKPTCMN